MIRKWIKLLPYWIVMKVVRSFNADSGTFNGKKVRYHQIDEGEFVVFSPEVQEVFDKRRRERDNEKKNKVKEKIWKILDNNISLKEEVYNELREQKEDDDFQ